MRAKAMLSKLNIKGERSRPRPWSHPDIRIKASPSISATAAVMLDAWEQALASTPLFAVGATVKKTGETYECASTKSHYIDDRGAFAREYGNVADAKEAKPDTTPHSL